MHRFSLLLVSFLVIFSFIVATGCQPGSDTPNNNNQQPTQDDQDDRDEGTRGDDTDEVDLPSPIKENGEIYFTGTDAAQMLAKWDDLGEDTERIKDSIEISDGEYVELQDWLITDVSWDEYWDIDYELQPGEWAAHAWGSDGVIDLDIYVYGPGGEEDIIASDELVDDWPQVSFTLQKPTDVTIRIDPYELEEDVDSIMVCFYIF